MKLSRPNKHEYYIGIAEAVSRRSTCLRRHYGCVIVNNDEIISTGYNGNPRGEANCVDIGECHREGMPHNSSPDSYNMCRSVHAEMNAIISASRAEMIGADLYLYGYDVEAAADIPPDELFPCPICLRLIQNAGIVRICTPSSFRVVSRTMEARNGRPSNS